MCLVRVKPSSDDEPSIAPRPVPMTVTTRHRYSTSPGSPSPSRPTSSSRHRYYDSHSPHTTAPANAYPSSPIHARNRSPARHAVTTTTYTVRPGSGRASGSAISPSSPTLQRSSPRVSYTSVDGQTHHHRRASSSMAAGPRVSFETGNSPRHSGSGVRYVDSGPPRRSTSLAHRRHSSAGNVVYGASPRASSSSQVPRERIVVVDQRGIRRREYYH
ncbi:MAG: hypothetical protein M1825_004745 [Sarcosagium campestre]|nr:MAG: hypothetical protein M1825_004745 [Sarcosagium campestre]